MIMQSPSLDTSSAVGGRSWQARAGSSHLFRTKIAHGGGAHCKGMTGGKGVRESSLHREFSVVRPHRATAVAMTRNDSKTTPTSARCWRTFKCRDRQKCTSTFFQATPTTATNSSKISRDRPKCTSTFWTKSKTFH